MRQKRDVARSGLAPPDLTGGNSRSTAPASRRRRQQEVERLDAAITDVGDVNVPLFVHRHARRKEELARLTPLSAPGGEELPVAIEDREAVVAGVGYVDTSRRVNRHVA